MENKSPVHADNYLLIKLTSISFIAFPLLLCFTYYYNTFIIYLSYYISYIML